MSRGHDRNRRSRVLRSGLLAAALVIVALAVVTPGAGASGRWLSGDVHTHTWLTDGKNTQQEVVRNAFAVYGLHYFANSEHGGQSTYDPTGVKFVAPIWRWITLPLYSYPLIQDARAGNPGKAVIQGVEWNAPTHEHASVGIVGQANEPAGISNFEYLFDQADTDISRANEGLQADPGNGNPAVPFGLQVDGPPAHSTY